MSRELAGSCFQKCNSAKNMSLRSAVAKHTIYLTQGLWPHSGFQKKKIAPQVYLQKLSFLPPQNFNQPRRAQNLHSTLIL